MQRLRVFPPVRVTPRTPRQTGRFANHKNPPLCVGAAQRRLLLGRRAGLAQWERRAAAGPGRRRRREREQSGWGPALTMPYKLKKEKVRRAGGRAAGTFLGRAAPSPLPPRLPPSSPRPSFGAAVGRGRARGCGRQGAGARAAGGAPGAGGRRRRARGAAVPPHTLIPTPSSTPPHPAEMPSVGEVRCPGRGLGTGRGVPFLGEEVQRRRGAAVTGRAGRTFRFFGLSGVSEVGQKHHKARRRQREGWRG